MRARLNGSDSGSPEADALIVPGEPSVAVVLVHYHTPELLAGAVESLQSELTAAGLLGEILVVDNGSTAAEREEMSGLPVRRIATEGNPGYAAALNLGIRETTAEILLLMNPDVLVLPGCLTALRDALLSGAAAAGPRFYWDAGRRFLLPPTEKRTRYSALLSALAGHGERWAASARRAWRAHAHRHWRAQGPFPTTALSGAMLAVRRDAVTRVGGFDEGYRLYFEENDWLVRLRRAGLESVLVPAAEAVHRFNQSAVLEPAAPRWFHESRQRYEARYYGAWFSALVAHLERGAVPAIAPTSTGGSLPRVELDPDDRTAAECRWLEMSPSPHGFPAAATRLEPRRAEWTFPEEVWPYLAPGTYYLIVCSASGREVLRQAFQRPVEAPGSEGTSARNGEPGVVCLAHEPRP